MMGHLHKSVEFWTKALALHDEFGALGGEKKRVELAQGLQAAKDRDSGKEAQLASLHFEKMKQADADKAARSDEFTFTEGEEETNDEEDES